MSTRRDSAARLHASCCPIRSVPAPLRGPSLDNPAPGRRVWWKCPKGPDHQWETQVTARISQKRQPSGCPFCANKRLSVTNALTVLYPKVARQWHPTKNGSLRAQDVVATSDRKVWWRCAVGHEWYTRVTIRTKSGSTCPGCKLRKVKPATTYKAPRIRVRLPADLS